MARDPLTVKIDWDDSGSFETAEVILQPDLLAVNFFYGCDTVSDPERAALASAFGNLTLDNLDRKYSPGISMDYTIAQLTGRHLCRIEQGVEVVWEGYLEAPELIVDRQVDEVTWSLVGKVLANLPAGQRTDYRVRLSNEGVDNQVSDLIDAWFTHFSDVTRQPALLTDFSIGAVAWDDSAIEFINECAAFEAGYAFETLDGKLAILSEARLAGDTPQYVSPSTTTIIHPAIEKPDIGRLFNRAIIYSTQAVKDSERVLLRIGGIRIPARGEVTDTYFVSEDSSDPIYTIDWTTPIVLDSDTLIQHRANSTDVYGPSTRVTGNLTAAIVVASTAANHAEITITNSAGFEKYIELLTVFGRPTQNLTGISQRTYFDTAGIALYGVRQLILRPFLRWFRKTGLGGFTTRATRLATLRDHLGLTFPLWQDTQAKVDAIHDIQPGSFIQVTLEGESRSMLALGIAIDYSWDSVPKKTVYCRGTADHTASGGEFTLDVSLLDSADVLG